MTLKWQRMGRDKVFVEEEPPGIPKDHVPLRPNRRGGPETCLGKQTCRSYGLYTIRCGIRDIYIYI